MTSYRDAAEVLWGPAGAFVHDSYARNRHLYPELPEVLPIVIGIAAYGHCDGLTRSDWRHGPRITIASSAFSRGAGYVDDVMVHEMLHAWLGLTGCVMKHAGEPWYAAVRRLSPVVLGRGVDVYRGRGRRSVRVPNPKWVEGGVEPRTVVRKERVEVEFGHAEVARWPMAFRPEGYDWGPGMDCPSY